MQTDDPNEPRAPGLAHDADDATDDHGDTAADHTDEPDLATPGGTDPEPGPDPDPDRGALDATATAADGTDTGGTGTGTGTGEVFAPPMPPTSDAVVSDPSATDPSGQTPPPHASTPPPPTPPTEPPGASGGSGPAAGQQWAAPGPRRLTRSRDRKLGGVAAGIADYLGIDPTLVRLGFLLAIFIGGAGVIAYVVAWIVLPEDDPRSPTGPGRPPMRVGRSGSGIDTTTALAVGLLVLAVMFGIAGPDGGGVLVPVAMIAGGIWLLSQREVGSPPAGDPAMAFAGAGDRPRSVDTTARFRADEPAAPQWEQTTDGWSWPEADSSPTPAPAPRRPAIVTRITLSLLALLAAGAIAANELELFDVTVPAVLAIALVGIGVAAITSAFIGRGRGLIPIGLLLVLAFAGAATAQPLIENGTGNRSYTPTSVADIRSQYELGIGDLDVDLSGLDIPTGTSVETTVDLGIGSAEVLVPADATVVVHGDVGIGELRVFEFFENGFGNELRRTRAAEIDDGSSTPTTVDDVGTPDDPGELVIRLEVGMGEGVVRYG